MKYALAVALLTAGLPALAAGPASVQPTLEFISGKERRVLKMEELSKKAKRRELTVYNPSYEREMTYEGFWLDEALEAAGLTVDPETDTLLFHCRDGYVTTMSAYELGDRTWLLSFGEKGGDWTILLHDGKEISPAPWYIVGKTAQTFQDFPWPYQVVAVEVKKGW